MQNKMNNSAPLPITMPFDKYKEGVRDVIYYDDKKLPGFTEVKDVFDFVSSDDKAAQVQYQSGDFGNFLPTKNFKITINADDVLKNHVVTPDQKDKIAPEMDWKYTSNYVTKENLAMLDILAHNNWVRPICFTTTIGQENLIGLQRYLYKEGFVYHLMPLKPDTTSKDQLSKINSLVMYDNIMNKFKFGNFKNARYLDHESTTMFYPVMITTFLDLTAGLIKDGHPDLALKALHKYDQELPDINTGLDVADRKIIMAQTAFALHDVVLADKFVTSVDNYVTDQLDYNYYLLQNNSGDLSARDVQYGISFISGLASLTDENHQTVLSAKLKQQINDYESKFGSILQRQQQ